MEIDEYLMNEEDPESTGLLAAGLSYALGADKGESKELARKVCEAVFGECPEAGRLHLMTYGFLLGVSEGMRMQEALMPPTMGEDKKHED